MPTTIERTFWDDATCSYGVTGRSTQLHTRWGTLHIERPDDGAASFWWHQKNHGVLTIPAALRNGMWTLWRWLKR